MTSDNPLLSSTLEVLDILGIQLAKCQGECLSKSRSLLRNRQPSDIPPPFGLSTNMKYSKLTTDGAATKSIDTFRYHAYTKSVISYLLIWNIFRMFEAKGITDISSLALSLSCEERMGEFALNQSVSSYTVTREYEVSCKNNAVVCPFGLCQTQTF